ncbi:transposase family protein [Streptomyces sp. NPDC052013]|uniref:transposase family protein n=1 Tax=Streptomyces sp. NPDC052013 TaxID=3365679 RepID=UPI0037CF193A
MTSPRPANITSSPPARACGSQRWPTWPTPRRAGIAVPARRRPGQGLTAEEKSLNKAHARLRSPVERGVATVKRWRIFRQARCSPNRLASAAKAVLTLERQR